MLGFSVEQPKGERFRIVYMEEGRAAARAGIAVGQWAVSYNLSPLKSNGKKSARSSSRVFERWTQSSLDEVNRHPANQAIAIKVVAPNGFSRECTDRMNHIQHAKQSVRFNNLGTVVRHRTDVGDHFRCV